MIKDDKIFYEYNLNLAHYDHIVCNKCEKIYEIKTDIVENRINDECKAFICIFECRALYI